MVGGVPADLSPPRPALLGREHELAERVAERHPAITALAPGRRLMAGPDRTPSDDDTATRSAPSSTAVAAPGRVDGVSRRPRQRRQVIVSRCSDDGSPMQGHSRISVETGGHPLFADE